MVERIKTTKQAAHGPHRSPEKTVQIDNIYDYIITLIKRRRKPLLISWEFIGSSFEQLESPSPKDALGWNWPSGFGEEDI